MKAQHVISAAAFSLVALAGAVSAQSTQGLVTVTTSSATTTPASGAMAATLGVITVSAPQVGDSGNIQVASIPVSLTVSGSGSASNLSNCRIFDANGGAIAGAAVSPVLGSNSFGFTTPIAISGGNSNTMTLRCDVATSTPSGTSFQISAGMPILAGNFGVNLNASPTARPGAQDTLLALITLSAARSGVPVQVSSIPLNVTFGSGAAQQNLSDCRIRNLTNLTLPLNNGANAVGIVAGTTAIPLDTALQIAAGSSATLTLTCDIDTSAPIGGTVAIGITPSALAATAVGTGTTITPTTGTGPNNQAGSTTGIVTFSNASTPIPTLPGVPNTGSDTANTIMLLALSGLVALLGIFLARRLAR